jgi:hypothetical protein
MRQQTLASEASFEKFGPKGEREIFLDQMKQVVPRSELLALVEPHYPTAGNGRQPVGLAIMLRTYFLQQWFNLSGPEMEEAFYDSPAHRRFAGFDLGVAAVPDETTILRFRPLLEQARALRQDAGHGESLSGSQRHPHQHWDHRGCNADQCSQFDEEFYWRARCTKPGRDISGISEPRRILAWIVRRS